MRLCGAKRRWILLTGVLAFPFLLSWRGVQAANPQPPAPEKLAPHERLITLLSTNDIHGGVEPTRGSDGVMAGGLAFFSGAVKAIKTGLHNKYGNQSGVLVVDGGDQFQGTLVSNYNEGQLVFQAMNEAGYDAAVPGNHDYDFGPTGWLDDKVVPGSGDQNPKGALERLVRIAKFPLISANTYLIDSLVNASGRVLEVSNSGCRPKAGQGAVDWKKARQPDFLKPYLLKEVGGVRVALIGLDNVGTPSTTTIENVTDLCFRDEKETYLEVVEELQGKADLFVLVLHNGNSINQFSASDLVRDIQASAGGSKPVLHAVIAGHTHFVNNTRIQNVPIVQSGSGGEMFGRVDLIWDAKAGRVKTDKTRTFAGVRMLPERCTPAIQSFCSSQGPSQDPSQDGDQGFTPVQELNPSARGVSYEGVPVVTDLKVLDLIREARKEVDVLAKRKIGHADGVIRRDRIAESPLSNAMTDAFRKVSGAEIATLNTGGLRDQIEAGDVTYEDLFKVLPFSNRGVIVAPMTRDQLIGLLEKSIRTCDAYGALMQSGLKVVFEKDCAKRNKNGVDPEARLLHVESLSGEVIYDVTLLPDFTENATRVFEVATLDFLASGGSGYDGFKGIPIRKDLGIVREALTEGFLLEPARFSTQIDGRWKEVKPAN